jgi:hypothetical protein
MRGVITNRDVMANLWLVRREFGFCCMVKCLLVVLSGRRTTFLEVAMRK